jgi:ribosomal protein S17E
MKKIQYFKLFESRTARLSDEEFINLVKTKCKDFLANPKYLQRMKKKYSGDYTYINPKLSYRAPLMADEMFSMGGVYSSHHTLLMDNLPSWKDFPKRTKSVIGSINFGYDPSFGDHYHCVIPYDGANFALAPDCDLWNSYCLIGNNQYQFDDYFSESFLQAGISDDSYDEMIEDIQKLYNQYLKGIDNNISGYITRIFKQMKEDNVTDVRLAFNEYFAPNKFRGLGPKNESKGFVTMNYSEISNIQEKDSNGNIITHGKEFWTDSECLIVYLGNVSSKDIVYKRYEEVLKLLS